MYSISDFLFSIYYCAISVYKYFALSTSISSCKYGIFLSKNCGDGKKTHSVLDDLTFLSTDLQYGSQVQSKKNDCVSLVILSQVAHMIQKEMLHCQRKYASMQ